MVYSFSSLVYMFRRNCRHMVFDFANTTLFCVLYPYCCTSWDSVHIYSRTHYIQHHSDFDKRRRRRTVEIHRKGSSAYIPTAIIVAEIDSGLNEGMSYSSCELVNVNSLRSSPWHPKTWTQSHHQWEREYRAPETICASTRPSIMCRTVRGVWSRSGYNMRRSQVLWTRLHPECHITRNLQKKSTFVPSLFTFLLSAYSASDWKLGVGPGYEATHNLFCCDVV